MRLDGYTEDEKVAIARDHLLARQLERNGLRARRSRRSSDDALRVVVTDYTREAGVRHLERELGKLLRKAAARVVDGDAAPAGHASTRRDVRAALGRARFFAEVAERTSVPGVATGLAVTGAGGDVLFVEATAMDGDPGLTLTGQLGDVMKESAQIALSYVRAHADGARRRSRPHDADVAPRARPCGRDPQGRAVGRRHDDHGAREPAHGPRRCGPMWA